MRWPALRPRRRAWTAAGVAVLACGAVAGCGAADFPNDPRPPAPYETTASIGAKSVNISPNKFGAGIVVVTVANLTTQPASFELQGPTHAESGTIQPKAVTTIKTTLKQGSYQAIAKGPTGI